MTLWAETPASAWNIALAGLFDAGPLLDEDGELRRDAVLAEIDGRLDAIPEMRQRVRWTRRGEGRPVWTDDPTFDLACHVETVPLVDADRPAFLDWAATWAARPLNRDRPLWRLAFVTGLASGSVGVVIKVHHAVADGVAGAALIVRLMDGGSHGAADRRAPGWAWQSTDLVRDALRIRALALAHAARGLRRLPAAARAARADLAATSRAVRGIAPDLGLPLPTGTDRRLVATCWPLADVKAIGHRHGGTVNDVVLTAVAAGMRRFLEDRGRPTNDLTLRVSVPVAASAGARNAGGTLPMVIALPLGEADPAATLRAIAPETAALKASRNRDYPGLTASPLMPVTLARAWTRWLRRHGVRRVNLFVTNVPGPKDNLCFHGARLRRVYPIAPVVAGVPLAVTVLSYAGTLVLTVNAAPTVAGLDAIVRGADDAMGHLRDGTNGEWDGASTARKVSP